MTFPLGIWHGLEWAIVVLLVFNIVQTEFYLRRSKRDFAAIQKMAQQIEATIRAERESAAGRMAWAGLQAGPAPGPGEGGAAG